MVAIRLRRGGSKNRPFYRIVVAERTSGRDGRFIEVLGHYNPRSQPHEVKVDRERLQHWLERGAQLTDTVRTLLARVPAEEPAGAVQAS
ncbi:MAG: 30S ribosomal protein S16 [Acidobacteriota bacterium]|jgi:small subunit ribosomal protein S16|nr:MAG: 30S ribosomal protein S16 [Acidobacteriota bacterium]